MPDGATAVERDREPTAGSVDALLEDIERRRNSGFPSLLSRQFSGAHGEADLLPSLVVDRYADFLVIQALSQGTDRLLPAITKSLVGLLSPKGILARNDPKVRALEGLDQISGGLEKSLGAGTVRHVLDRRTDAVSTALAAKKLYVAPAVGLTLSRSAEATVVPRNTHFGD